MYVAFLGVGAVAVALTLLAASAGGVLGWIGAVVAGLVALFALGTFAFSAWGRYVGYPWHFTP